MKSFGIRIFLLLLCFLSYGNVYALDNREKDLATTLVHRFFILVYQKKYEKAYDCFSSSVKDDVSISRFKEGAQDVKYLKILSIKVLDREENLIKMKIRTLIHLVYDGNLYEAMYEGKVDVYRENGNWRLITVDLEAKSQKPLGKKATPGQLQKLDFGTGK